VAVNPSSYRKLVARRLSRNFREAVEIVETPWVEPGPDEIVVRNWFAGVNASDVNISAGVYFVDPNPPFDLGVEAAGEVVAVGANVRHLKVGDQVITAMLGGGYREYQRLNATLAIPAPATPEALTIVVSALTAAVGLETVGKMGQGETVLVTAAAGGVGHYAVQLAKLAGNHVIGTCRSAEKAALLRELGCDRVINYQEEDLGDVLAREYPNGIDLIFESVGGQLFDTCVEHLAVRGRLIICGYVSEYTSDAPEVVCAPRIYHQLLWKSATVQAFLFSHYVEHIPAHLGRLMELYGNGSLTAAVDPTEFRGLESIPDAVEHLYRGANRGKIIVRL
jgi:NADPH-dependent curcumin reductase CurA